MTNYDVIVIGGGPTGLSTSITTTKHGGLKTLILEEHSGIGNPLACGEGISTEKLLTLENMPSVRNQLNESTLALQRHDSFLERSVLSQRFFFGKNSVATSELKTVTINRPLFDQMLAKEAENNGAIIKLNSQVKSIQRKDDILEVETNDQSYFSPLVIGCDGPSAHSVKMMGLDPPSEYVQGVEYKIEGVHTDALDFYFDFESFPKMHYGWVFPKKSHTNIGIVIDPASRPKKILQQFLQYLKNPDILSSNIIKEIAGVIPACGPIPKRYCDNYMVAGDAAGMTNSIFYGGIAIGIHSGMLAGRTAIKAHMNQKFDEELLSEYQRECDSYPYSDPEIQEAHKILYTKFSSSELESFGKLVNGWDLTTLDNKKKFLLGFKLLRRPSFIKRFKDLRTIAHGFSKSRDWGF
ncbi:MAG: NAD(P)/FAD-dependent oxidoreductase [Candidatus Hodarchaeales archaeon]|jgi:electron transfer flavoprotein-quinone oxidoreductase